MVCVICMTVFVVCVVMHGKSVTIVPFYLVLLWLYACLCIVSIVEIMISKMVSTARYGIHFKNMVSFKYADPPSGGPGYLCHHGAVIFHNAVTRKLSFDLWILLYDFPT
jgi:hypothetical protein